MNLSQRQLRMFVVTAATLNITRASEALHISQPALTRALQEFESQLGVVLLRRTTRQLSLSHEGAAFLPVAQHLLRQMEEATAALRSDRAALRGSVTLAVGTAFGCTVLPAALKLLARAHPGVRVRLIDDNSGGIVDRVRRGEADLGICSPMGNTSGLLCDPLLTAPIGLLGDAKLFRLKGRITAGALAGMPVLKEPEDASILHVLRGRGSELVSYMEGGIEVSSLALQIALAREGIGVAVVSALGASHPAAQGLAFAPLSPRVEREVFLVRRRDRDPAPACRALAQAVLDELRRCSTLHRAVRLTGR